jgi:hypothetical protein
LSARSFVSTRHRRGAAIDGEDAAATVGVVVDGGISCKRTYACMRTHAHISFSPLTPAANVGLVVDGGIRCKRLSAHLRMHAHTYSRTVLTSHSIVVGAWIVVQKPLSKRLCEHAHTYSQPFSPLTHFSFFFSIFLRRRSLDRCATAAIQAFVQSGK